MQIDPSQVQIDILKRNGEILTVIRTYITISLPYPKLLLVGGSPVTCATLVQMAMLNLAQAWLRVCFSLLTFAHPDCQFRQSSR